MDNEYLEEIALHDPNGFNRHKFFGTLPSNDG